MTEDVSKENLRPNTLFLSENVILPLFDRKDRSYSINLHLKFLDQKDNVDVPKAFIENITDPLFRDFSKGNPKYEEVRNPEENIGIDFEIIENLYDFVEDNSSELEDYNGQNVVNAIQSFPDTLRTRRAFDYIEEVCRRAGTDTYSDMEGMQITTPYDYNDIVSLIEKERVESEADDGVEALLEYGPDKVGFDDILEGYKVYGKLKSRFCEREIPNRVNGPDFTFFSE